jgi:4-amino-4-deoxy-L-arabinose transferase-like glycosyltransferase
MTNLKWVLVVALILTLVRVGMVFSERISPQEAYYALCANQPAPAYFDGPAGTALTAGLLTQWNSFAGRVTAPLWALAATLTCFFLVRGLTNELTAGVTALVLNCLPIFNDLSLRIGPELPALTFVLLSLLAGWRGFVSEKLGVAWWTLAGLLIAGASAFSYAAVMVAPALAIFIWYSRKHRNPAGIVSGLIILAPPALALVPALRWNAAHDWIPVAGGTLQTAWQFRPGGAISSLLQTLHLISPLVFVGIVVAWVISARGAHAHLRARFIFIGALPGMVLGFYAFYRGADAVFYFLLVTPLLLARAGEWAMTLPSGRIANRLAVLLAIILSLASVWGALEEGRSWHGASAKVREFFFQRLAAGQNDLFLIAEDPPMASILGYYLKDDLIPPPGHPTVYVQASQDISSQFSLWPGYDDFIASDHPSDEYFTEQKGENPFIGRSALYVTYEAPDDLPQAIKGAFESVKQAAEIPGMGKEPLYIYLCVNYQTLPL